MTKGISALTIILTLMLLSLSVVVLAYALVVGVSSRVPSTEEFKPVVLADAAVPPKNYTVVVEMGKEPRIADPLRIYVKNVGRSEARLDVAYIEDEEGALLAVIKLDEPVVVRPGEIAEVDVPLSEDVVNKLSKVPGSIVVRMSGTAGTTSPVELPPRSIYYVKPTISSTVFKDVVLVIINASDSYSWWVDVSEVVKAAKEAYERLKLKDVVVLENSSSIHDLIKRGVLRGWSEAKRGYVEYYASNLTLVIVDAHGEVLPIPPQYIKDIDNDGMLEIRWCQYAQDFHSALSSHKWILVTLVGAPLYYVSSKGIISGSDNNLYFVNETGSYTIDATYKGAGVDTLAEWSVDTDCGTITCQIRKGLGNPLVCVLERRFTYAILTGGCDNNSGPDWPGAQNGDENRVAYDGRSWHNFDALGGWGGAVALELNINGTEFKDFTGVSLPEKVSAARAVSVEWLNSEGSYAKDLLVASLYALNQSTVYTEKVVLHYDDFEASSLRYLDAGEGRNLTYWANLNSTAEAEVNAAEHALHLGSGAIVVRHLVGWADFSRSFNEVFNHADKVVYNLALNTTGDGTFYLLLGNTSNDYWVALKFAVSEGEIINASLVSLDITDLKELESRRLSFAEPVELPASITVEVNATHVEVEVSGRPWATVSWSSTEVNVGASHVVPGFAWVGEGRAVVYGPFEIHAVFWRGSGGFASAVFKVGNGYYIHAGYSPPHGVVKEFGYSLNTLNVVDGNPYRFLAVVGIYYPLYLIYKGVIS